MTSLKKVGPLSNFRKLVTSLRRELILKVERLDLMLAEIENIQTVYKTVQTNQDELTNKRKSNRVLCEKCKHANVRAREKTNDLFCRTCGHVQKISWRKNDPP